MQRVIMIESSTSPAGSNCKYTLPKIAIKGTRIAAVTIVA
jgi:hypothetical protein